MGLPINKLIVATNQNDILHRAISKGSYEAQEVTETNSPSMDIQIASNFERLIYDINESNDLLTNNIMKGIKETGKYHIATKELEKINSNFLSSSVSEEEVVKIIKNIYEKHKIMLDPHTAIGYGALKKVNIDGINIILATAHPCKFPKVILEATGVNEDLPEELKFILDEKENYDVIENNLDKIKQHIKERI